MLVEGGKFNIPADFVILKMEDNKVPLILGRPFHHTADAVIRFKQKQLNLGVRIEQMIFNINSMMKHSYSNDDTYLSIDVIDEILEEDFDALLDEELFNLHRTLLEEEIFAEFDEFMAMTADENSDSESDNKEPPFEKITLNTNYKIKTSLKEPPMDLELKPIPDNLEYEFMEEPSFLPVIISSQLFEEKKNKLISVLKNHKQAFAWKTIDIFEKTTFTCPFGTHTYRRMPISLCNALATFKRGMLAIFHDMIEESVEVFMDAFSVFGNFFKTCLKNLNKMLQHCKDAHLVLNWEKCHFMVKEGIVLGHKLKMISRNLKGCLGQAALTETKDLHTADYTKLYDFLKYNQKEVDELKAERIAKTQNPLALMANSNNPYAFPAPHQDQSSFNQNYLQQPMPNPEDITDPTTAMNMALALMEKAFKLNYSTPTNNNQRISLNPRNRQIAQPGMNMGQDRQMQMVIQNAVQNPKVQNVVNPNGLIGVQGNRNQNQIGNGNLVAARAKRNVAGQNGTQIRCYNCRGVEEYDLMAAAADLDEIKEVNANCILMANLQQASTSGTQTDSAPVYDTDGSAEEKSTVSFLLEEKKRLKSDFKTREDKLLDKQIRFEKRIKELNNIVLKMGQSIQTIHMLSPKPNSFYHTEQKMALGYQNPCYLKQAQKKQQSLVNIETHNWASSAHQELRKIVREENFPIVNQVDARLQNFEIQFLKEAAKFVGDFKSLANEADGSFAKHKALELDIERLLKAVVS
nr:reverse transcriptase domain-containing protein [Tanacetum cinerariifolium]